MVLKAKNGRNALPDTRRHVWHSQKHGLLLRGGDVVWYLMALQWHEPVMMEFEGSFDMLIPFV